MKNELRTFAEWSADGYKILKGSKSVGRDPNGVCLFSSDQVVKPPSSVPPDEEDDEFDPDLPGNPYDYGDS